MPANFEMDVDDGGGRMRRVPVELPGNSKYTKPKPDEEKEKVKVNPVVTGKVIQRKKGFGSRIRSSLTSGESPDTIAEWVAVNVLVPAAKSLIVDTFGMFTDAFKEGIERAIYGDRPSRSPHYSGGIRYDRARIRPGPAYSTITPRARSRHEFGDVILSTREEAYRVLEGLRDLIEEYEIATVENYYELVGITGDFTDTQWGWYDLQSASVRPVRGGYIVILPRTQSVDNR